MMTNGSLDWNGTWQLGFGDGIRGTPALAERNVIDPQRYLSAQVPGEIHLDLERLGLIDDVRVGLNAMKARWVEETRWVYRREFDAPHVRRFETIAASGRAIPGRQMHLAVATQPGPRGLVRPVAVVVRHLDGRVATVVVHYGKTFLRGGGVR